MPESSEIDVSFSPHSLGTPVNNTTGNANNAAAGAVDDSSFSKSLNSFDLGINSHTITGGDSSKEVSLSPRSNSNKQKGGHLPTLSSMAEQDSGVQPGADTGAVAVSADAVSGEGGVAAVTDLNLGASALGADYNGPGKISANNPYLATDKQNNSRYGFSDEYKKYDPNLPEPSLHLKLDAWLQRTFSDIGMFAARGNNAIWLIIGTLVLGIGLASGSAVKEAEERPDRLWIPENAPALDDSDWVTKTWPGTTVMNIALTSCKGGPATGCNMLTVDKLKLMYEQYYDILQVEVDGKAIHDKIKARWGTDTGPWSKYDGKSYAYDPQYVDATVPAGLTRTMKCNHPTGACKKRTVWELIGVDLNNRNWFNGKTDSDILSAINSYSGDVPVGSVLGSMVGAPGSITGAGIISTQWELENDDFIDTKDSMRRKEPIADRWEHDALCIIVLFTGILGRPSFRDRDGNFEISTICEKNAIASLETRLYFRRSLSDEFGRSFGGDQALISSAPMMMLMLGKRDRVHSMIALSIVAIVGIFLAIFAGLGCAYLAGVKDCVLRFNIFFLVLGLGVDDAFVIVSEYDRAMRRHPNYGIEEIMGTTVRTSGMSILVTSLTDAVAFLVGSTSSIPALSWFCSYAAFAIILVFIFQLTFFVPALVLDHKRAAIGNRYDCCCCPNAGCCPKVENEVCSICCKRAPVWHHYIEPTGYCGNKVQGCGSVPLLPRLIDSWVRFILTPAMRIVTIIVWLSLCTAAIVGLANLKADFQLEWFFPPDSYVVDYFKWSEDYFSQGTRLSLYMKDFQGLSESQQWTCLDSMNTYMTGGGGGYLDATQQRPSWVTKFKAWKANPGGATVTNNFYTDLNTWQGVSGASGGSAYKTWRWNTAGTPSDGLAAVKISNGIIREDKIDGGGWERFDTMEAIRAGTKAACSVGLAYSREFLYWEETGYIGPEFARNAIICSGVILLIVFCLIPKVSVNVPCIATIFSTILMCLGFLHWYGETINGVVSIYTVICIGLSVDYVAHIGHMFKLSQAPTGAAKTLDAMTRIGPSVFNALFSTLLAVSLLAPSGSFVFSVFFKVLFLVVVFGTINAMWITPVLLCLCNGGGECPPPRADGEVGVEGASIRGSKVSTPRWFKDNFGVGGGGDANAATAGGGGDGNNTEPKQIEMTNKGGE